MLFRRFLLATAAVLMLGTPAVAADSLTDCVCKIHIVHDGKTYNLRANEDFKVERSPYGAVRVIPKTRIQKDPRWAHANAAIKVCIDGEKHAARK